jgi:putative tryptophan/tyrosine transport system substrate-binding protein
MRRRDFLIHVAGGMAAWPVAAGAQSRSTPVIGFLNSGSEEAFAGLVNAFRRGLSEEGYTEGRNVTIEYRWAKGDYDRLPALSADLVSRQVTVIAATGGTMSGLAAKAATSTIPVLFIAGSDPIAVGLVASYSRPGGNATGVNVYTTEMVGKRLGLLRELAPKATTIAMLVNPGATSAEFERKFANELERKDMAAAAQAAGVKLLVAEASAASDLPVAFDQAMKSDANALVVSADPFFNSERAQIVALADRHRLPAIYPWRQYAEGGGLMSYGPSIRESYRQIGVYAGRLLKGAKPGELPVQRPMRFELLINLKGAKALGLDIPPMLLARADEVIE